MRRMGHVQKDAARLIILLPDHDDFFGGLDEIDGLHAVEEETGDAHRPTAGLATKSGSSGEDSLVALTQLLSSPGLENRVADVGSRKCRLGGLDSSAGGIVWKQVHDLRMGWIVGDRARPARRRLEPTRDGNPAYPAVVRKVGHCLRADGRPERRACAKQAHQARTEATC